MNEEFILVVCPNCKNLMQIFKKDFNCKIFRHGVYKKTYTQIDPHLKKAACDNLIKNNLIYGCAKPFQLYTINNSYYAKKCDYI